MGGKSHQLFPKTFLIASKERKAFLTFWKKLPPQEAYLNHGVFSNENTVYPYRHWENRFHAVIMYCLTSIPKFFLKRSK